MCQRLTSELTALHRLNPHIDDDEIDARCADHQRWCGCGHDGGHFTVPEGLSHDQPALDAATDHASAA